MIHSCPHWKFYYAILNVCAVMCVIIYFGCRYTWEQFKVAAVHVSISSIRRAVTRNARFCLATKHFVADSWVAHLLHHLYAAFPTHPPVQLIMYLSTDRYRTIMLRIRMFHDKLFIPNATFTSEQIVARENVCVLCAAGLGTTVPI